jgi:hypothetical protein
VNLEDSYNKYSSVSNFLKDAKSSCTSSVILVTTQAKNECGPPYTNFLIGINDHGILFFCALTQILYSPDSKTTSRNVKSEAQKLQKGKLKKSILLNK